MANLTSEINNFRNAVYGEEVRGSLITAIQRINEEVESYTALVTTKATEINTIKTSIEALESTVSSNEDARQTWYTTTKTEYSDWFDGNTSKNIVGVKTLELQRQSDESQRKDNERTRQNNEISRTQEFNSFKNDYTDWFEGNTSKGIVGVKDLEIQRQTDETTRQNNEANRIAAFNTFSMDYNSWYTNIKNAYDQWFEGDPINGIDGVKDLETQRQINETGRISTFETLQLDYNKWYSDVKSDYNAWFDKAEDAEKARDDAETERVQNDQKRNTMYSDLVAGSVPVATFNTIGTVMIGDGFNYDLETGRLSVAGYGDLVTKAFLGNNNYTKNQIDNTVLPNVLKNYLQSSYVDGTTIQYDTLRSKLKINPDITWNQLAQTGGS